MTVVGTVPHQALEAPKPRMVCFAAVKSTVTSAAIAALLPARSDIAARPIAATGNGRRVFRYMFYCPSFDPMKVARPRPATLAVMLRRFIWLRAGGSRPPRPAQKATHCWLRTTATGSLFVMKIRASGGTGTPSPRPRGPPYTVDLAFLDAAQPPSAREAGKCVTNLEPTDRAWSDAGEFAYRRRGMQGQLFGHPWKVQHGPCALRRARLLFRFQHDDGPGRTLGSGRCRGRQSGQRRKWRFAKQRHRGEQLRRRGRSEQRRRRLRWWQQRRIWRQQRRFDWPRRCERQKRPRCRRRGHPRFGRE